MNQQTLINYGHIAIIILLVIGLGVFAFNQIFEWHYKMQFLQKPCDLCISLNPNFTRCSASLISNAQNFNPYNYTINFTNQNNLLIKNPTDEMIKQQKVQQEYIKNLS